MPLIPRQHCSAPAPAPDGTLDTSADPRQAPPPVAFVGAGPGAEDLLTLRGLRALQAAEVVLYDSLGVSEAMLALCPQAERIAVGKRAGRHSVPQSMINRRLVNEARRGRRVVRLKGGDGGIFGRLEEEIDALRSAGLAFQIVPGVTAASAAAAEAGLPLTRRGVSRAVTLATPARADDADAAGWTDGLDPGATTVLYMAGRDLARHAASMLARGFRAATPVLVGWGVSTPAQRFWRGTLGLLADAPPEGPAHAAGHAPPPCLLMVGEALGDDAVSERSASAAAA